MKKYLLPRNGKFYKANMHAHTTVSDGRLSPEEMKRAFMERGYSIVAFTDHEVMVPHLPLFNARTSGVQLIDTASWFFAILPKQLQPVKPKTATAATSKSLNEFFIVF